MFVNNEVEEESKEKMTFMEKLAAMSPEEDVKIEEEFIQQESEEVEEKQAESILIVFFSGSLILLKISILVLYWSCLPTLSFALLRALSSSAEPSSLICSNVLVSVKVSS